MTNTTVDTIRPGDTLGQSWKRARVFGSAYS